MDTLGQDNTENTESSESLEQKRLDNKENRRTEQRISNPRGHNRKDRNRYYQDKKRQKQQAAKNPNQSDVQKLKFKKVSILIPLFNEQDSLPELSREINAVFKNLSTDHEILFVDDGSTDNSLKVIKDIARSNNKVRYISFRKNYGKSAALNVGFKNVTGDAVITMDADLQDDPHEIPHLLKELEKGYDLVSGWKKQRHDPFIKKYSSRFFNYTTKIMSGIKIHDFNCGLKAYRRTVVKSISVQGELHRYIPVLADWRGFKVSEVIVKHHPRRYGKTKFGISRFFKGFIDLITVIFTTRYIQRPLHFFGLLGVVTFIIGFTIDAYLSILWFMDKINLSNRPILYLGTVLIIVGVQFFSLGLIGEMLVHNNNKEDTYGIKEKKLRSIDNKKQH